MGSSHVDGVTVLLREVHRRRCSNKTTKCLHNFLP